MVFYSCFRARVCSPGGASRRETPYFLSVLWSLPSSCGMLCINIKVRCLQTATCRLYFIYTTRLSEETFRRVDYDELHLALIKKEWDWCCINNSGTQILYFSKSSNTTLYKILFYLSKSTKSTDIKIYTESTKRKKYSRAHFRIILYDWIKITETLMCSSL